MEDNPGQLLDLSTVKVIRALNNAENNFLAELIALFTKESERAVWNLTEAASEQDEKSLVSYLHSFKGMCVNMGAIALANLCQNLEDELKTLSYEDVKASVEKIRKCRLGTVEDLNRQV